MLKKLGFCLVATAVLLVFYTVASFQNVLPSSALVIVDKLPVTNARSVDAAENESQTLQSLTQPRPSSLISPVIDNRRFAVFSCSTPEKKKSHRGYDYAFYLPLTALAWKRIGFESIVLIIGEKSEWKNNSVLSHVVDTLESLAPDVTVLFLPAKIENRVMLSQTARIFMANMDEFPGRSSDFILTSDSDLWPLRKQHFYQPEDNVNRPLMLFHSDCCRPFVFKGRSYKMQPMSHVGASATTWKEMINSNSSIVAKDSPSILNRLEEIFGHQVRHRVIFASADWFLDQKFVTMSIEQWLSHHQTSPKKDCVYKVSDVGFQRLNRLAWNVNKMSASSFAKLYDAHLIVGGFQPHKWKSIRPLLHLMYGNGSSLYQFCDQFAKRFHELFTTYKT